MSNSLISQSLDSIFASSPIGSLDKALSNNIRGFNALQSNSVLPPSQDHQGYLFLTRPQLNMQKENLRNYAPMYALLNDDPNSDGMAIRSLLDPRIGAGYTFPVANGRTRTIPPLPCNIIDNENAFIPFVTNNVISSTGWSDKTLPMGSTDAGLYGQKYIFVDGISRSFEDWDLTINLQNVKGDLAVAMFSYWIDYASLIKEGKLSPYFDYIINNRADFHTRAYRLVMDKNKEFVTKILACGAGVPTSSPYGMFGDFDRSIPFSEQTKELSFRFRCMGQFHNDPRLIDSFNRVVCAFNPSMWDNFREDNMVRVPRHYLSRFQSRIYPRINPDSLRLEWWTPVAVWERLTNGGYSVDSGDMEQEPQDASIGGGLWV